MKYKPNYYLSLSKNLFSIRDNELTRVMRIFFENLFDHDFLEKYLEKLEMQKIKNNPKTKNFEGLIDADNRALIFLPHPQGPKIFEKFKNKLNDFNFYR